MTKINMGRVLLGGLVAGLIINVCEFLLNAVVLAEQMKSFNAQHNFSDPGPSFIVIAVLMCFLLGIVIVLGYACIRPRFGPGVKTAIIAAIFAWFGVCFYNGVFFFLLFGLPTGTCILINVWCLVEYVIASLVGAWLYKEA